MAVKIKLEGLDRTIETKPQGVFRRTGWVREFYEKHRIGSGDLLALEWTSNGSYRLYPFETQSERSNDWQHFLDEAPPGKGPTVLELFSGCGGMALGFKRAGFRTSLCVEWDAAACETIRRNITQRVAQCSIQDIERFPAADVVAGGPPCQGFSNLGERVPDDPRNQLWRQYLRGVLDAKPKVFVLENVPPLLRSAEYVELCKVMTDAGYTVEGRVLNSADYGAPQTRKRAIVIGVRGGTPSFPEPTHVDPLKKNLLTSKRLPWLTVREAIGDLPFIPTEVNWHISRNPTPMSLERYRHVPLGGNRFDLPARLTPGCWKRKTKGGTDLFGRLWWDRPSVTIRCEFYKPEKGRYLHPEAHRPITHREAARLQGFPDDFVFEGKRIEVGVQIGNAVPPQLSEAIARHIKEHLLDNTSKTRQRKRAGTH
ncbi:MAG: DNA cytosine methyltransferase [Phycisphaerae bacterium]|nr:DNA cytosine methyltransferase [Phycisphaerae bacterium]